MNAKLATSHPAPYLIKIGEDGALLPRDATGWVAVLDERTNLMWDVKARPVKNYAAALKVSEKLERALTEPHTRYQRRTAQEAR